MIGCKHDWKHLGFSPYRNAEMYECSRCEAEGEIDLLTFIASRQLSDGVVPLSDVTNSHIQGIIRIIEGDA